MRYLVRTCLVTVAGVLSCCPYVRGQEIHVVDSEGLALAVRAAAPGTTVLLAPGEYRGGLHLEHILGTEQAPISIRAADPNEPPVFRGGGQALHLSDCSHVTLRHIRAEGFPSNGINIDDGGSFDTPAHHILL